MTLSREHWRGNIRFVSDIRAELVKLYSQGTGKHGLRQQIS